MQSLGPRPSDQIPRRAAGALVIANLVACGAVASSFSVRAPPANPAVVRSRLNGRMTVGVDPSYPPFASLNPQGAPVGFDIDFAGLLAGRLGARSEFVGIDMGAIFEALMQRRFDVVISGAPPLPEYARFLAYSRGYFNAGPVLVMRSAADRAALAGSIAVERGTLAEVEARRFAARRAELRLEPLASVQECFAAVREGLAVAAIVDRVTAYTLRGEGLAPVEPPITFDPYVVAVHRRDGGLLSEIDSAIGAMERAGDLRRLEEQWLRPLPT
jgi:ABC-type amino acid transport substrate-binding protein